MLLTDLAVLTRLIEPIVADLGFELVRVHLSGGNDKILQVMAEQPATGQLHINDCVRLSHALSDMLDLTDPIADPYRLEVSSPGIDRPLTRPHDFEKWAGFEAKVALKSMIQGRKRLQGRLQGVTEERVALQTSDGTTYQLPFAEIDSARLVITDDLLKATAPAVVEINAARQAHFIDEISVNEGDI